MNGLLNRGGYGETEKIHNEGTKATKTNGEKMLPAIHLLNSLVNAGEWSGASFFFVRLRYLRFFVVNLLRSLRSLRNLTVSLSDLDDSERLRRTHRGDTVADEFSERGAIPARRDKRPLRRTAATAEPTTAPLTLIGARRSGIAA